MQQGSRQTYTSTYGVWCCSCCSFVRACKRHSGCGHCMKFCSHVSQAVQMPGEMLSHGLYLGVRQVLYSTHSTGIRQQPAVLAAEGVELIK